MRYMLDLFSGLGGASEAMIQDDDWSVLRVENNPLLSEVPNTVIMTVQQFRAKASMYAAIKPAWDELETIDLIWASPPCTEFSNAYDAPGPRAKRAGIPFSPDLSLVREAKAIIDTLQPKFWAIENVAGSIKHLTPILGEPRLIAGPFVLWGNFPLFSLPSGWKHSKFEKDTWSSDPLRANKRAKVPIQVSSALKSAVENQRSLFSF